MKLSSTSEPAIPPVAIAPCTLTPSQEFLLSNGNTIVPTREIFVTFEHDHLGVQANAEGLDIAGRGQSDSEALDDLLRNILLRERFCAGDASTEHLGSTYRQVVGLLSSISK